jgi:hypothetical protein
VKGDEAKRAYDAFVKNVLRHGTKISVLIRSPRPSTQHYLLECIIPNRTTIRGETGALVDGLKPQDLVPGLEIYGQHELSELTRSPEKLAKLLDRFVDKSRSQVSEPDLIYKLAASRSEIDRLNTDVKRYTDDLAGLPVLKERQNATKQ